MAIYFAPRPAMSETAAAIVVSAIRNLAVAPVSPPTGAAPKDECASPKPRWGAGAIGSVLFIVGACFAARQFGTPESGPIFKPVAGVGTFALFYVVAQAAERFTEVLLGLLDPARAIPGLGMRAAKEARDEALVSARNALVGDEPAAEGTDPAKDAATKQAVVDAKTTERKALTFGLTAMFGMVLCGWLEADFLTTLGVTFAENPGKTQFVVKCLEMAVTGAVVGGGSAGLHDRITRISKANAQADAGASLKPSA